MNYVIKTFGLAYSVGTFTFTLILAWLAFSKYRDIRLGTENSRPEFSTFSWLGMLLTSSMGTVIIIWGIAEPVSHYVAPLGDIPPESPAAASFAFRKYFLHQGLQAWSMFVVPGLAVAYLAMVVMVYALGETTTIINVLLTTTGDYISNFFKEGLEQNTFGNNRA